MRDHEAKAYGMHTFKPFKEEIKMSMSIRKLSELLKERRELEYIINNIYCDEMSEEENELDRVNSLKKLRKEFYRKVFAEFRK